MVEAKKPKKTNDPSLLGTFIVIQVRACGVVRSYQRTYSQLNAMSFGEVEKLLESQEETPGEGYWELYHFFKASLQAAIPEMIPAEYDRFRAGREKEWWFRERRDEQGRLRVTVHHRDFNDRGV